MVPEIVDMVMPVEGVFHNMVIVKIKKDYPGQAIKVMNALWGAGQMMFTKIMVIVDGDVNIHSNVEVAKYISSHTNPSSDIYFTQGPTDVLDHSCSKMAFGGKMGIDATKKMEEERSLEMSSVVPISFDDSVILNKYTEIKSINSTLLSKEISVVFMSVTKNRKNHIRELSEQLSSEESLKNIKLILLVEDRFDISDISDAVWRFANNFDPKRDKFTNGNMLILDGTRKTKEFDNFQRDWPNILASEKDTIEKIDALWPKLGLGPFIPSPSAKYRKQLYKGGAAVSE